ncbi:hypothetical protein ACLB2K_024622 [Fragaria x ananassa]
MSTSDEQKRPHVLKFGDWNNKGDDAPYTAAFDKARKSKLKDGVKIINPNDHQENPEACTIVEKERVKDELEMNMKLPIVAEENRKCSSESETIAPRPSHSRRLSHHRRKSDESDLSVCSEKLSFECNNSSFILQQRRQQRLRERYEKNKSMNSSSKRFGSSVHHRKRSSISDIDMITTLTRACLHPNGLQQRPRSFSLPGESAEFQFSSEIDLV